MLFTFHCHHISLRPLTDMPFDNIAAVKLCPHKGQCHYPLCLTDCEINMVGGGQNIKILLSDWHLNTK